MIAVPFFLEPDEQMEEEEEEEEEEEGREAPPASDALTSPAVGIERRRVRASAGVRT